MQDVDVLEVATPTAMRALGAELAALLGPGDLVVLTGELGAGKTVLVQGIAAGLGVSERVTSPTFVISHEHRDGRIPLVHVDAYRLGGTVEVDDLDLDVAGSVVVVEWGAGKVEQLADERLEVRITRHVDDDVREVALHPVGQGWVSRVADRP